MTDERVPEADKKLFAFPLSIHGIERAGAEAGVRAAEDLATWAACEAGTGDRRRSPARRRERSRTRCSRRRRPRASPPARRCAAPSVYFIFANPDGWRRGDRDNGVRFFQRYNGNGVDMNRDWPSLGFTFRPYTPWSEPETRGFGKVLKQIRPKWDGGIDLHGQLIDRAFSFTLLGQGEHDYAKNQRILQTVKGAWADAENRLAWSPLIKPNSAPKDDQRLYGVQWGTVWDTIAYTTTGAFGDWIDSPLGLDADGIDNEMSLSHISNCGVGLLLPRRRRAAPRRRQQEPRLLDDQLHAQAGGHDLPRPRHGGVRPQPEGRLERRARRRPRRRARACRRRRRSWTPRSTPATTSPTSSTSRASPRASGTAASRARSRRATSAASASSGRRTSSSSATAPVRATPGSCGCGEDGDDWSEVNRYFNQDDTYQQSGAAVHGNMPIPGRYRICLVGGLATKLRAAGGAADLDITFTTEKAWEDPGQKPYSATNMKFFDSLGGHMAPGQLVSVTADQILSGAVNLDRFSSLVVADDAFPGYVEAIPTGPAQGGITFPDVAAKTALTVPCAYQPGTADVLPPTCPADFEFDVDGAFNNQQHDDRARRAELGRLGPLHRAAEPRLRCVVAGGPGRDGRGERGGDDRQAAAGPLSRPRRQLVGGRAGGRPVRDVLERLPGRAAGAIVADGRAADGLGPEAEDASPSAAATSC